MSNVLSAEEFREIFTNRPLFIEDHIDAMYTCYRLGHLQGFKNGKAHQIREEMKDLNTILADLATSDILKED